MVRRAVFAAGENGRRLSIPRLLFAFLGAPVIWALHLGAIYFLVTLDCTTPWDGARWAVAMTTLLAAGASLSAGWTAWRLRRRMGGPEPKPPADEREWTGFVLTGGLAASALFTAVIVLEGVAPYFVRTCA